MNEIIKLVQEIHGVLTISFIRNAVIRIGEPRWNLIVIVVELTVIGQRMAVVKNWPLLEYVWTLMDHGTIVYVLSEESGGGPVVHVVSRIPGER